jgi:nitroreductase
MTATHDTIPGHQTAALDTAARLAMRAPSALNTQPWRWRVHGDALELRADYDRQLTAVDPEVRLLPVGRRSGAPLLVLGESAHWTPTPMLLGAVAGAIDAADGLAAVVKEVRQ